MRPQYFFNVRLIFLVLTSSSANDSYIRVFGLKYGTFTELPRTLNTQPLYSTLNYRNNV